MAKKIEVSINVGDWATIYPEEGRIIITTLINKPAPVVETNKSGTHITITRKYL